MAYLIENAPAIAQLAAATCAVVSTLTLISVLCIIAIGSELRMMLTSAGAEIKKLGAGKAKDLAKY